MKVNVDIKNPVNKVVFENDAEREILLSEELRSKLALESVKSLETNHKRIIFRNSYRITSKGVIHLDSSLYEDPRKMSFYLRSILDGNSIGNGCMPLHAAAFSVDGNVGFLIARSNGGKSTTLEKLCSKGVHPIGDDHIIIGEKNIRGNDVIRLRTTRGDKYAGISSEATPFIGGYGIFIVELSDNYMSEPLDSEGFYTDPDIRRTLLKYLKGDPIDIEAKILIKRLNEPHQDRYDEMFGRFSKDANKIFYVSGQPEEVTREILGQMEGIK